MFSPQARTKLSLLLATAAIAACSALALPSIASASDYCVGVTPVACPVQTYPATEAGIANATGAANATAGADRIFLAAGSYPIASSLSLSFTGNVQILGAGAGQTIFSSSAFAGTYLGLELADATSKISGFTMNMTGAPGGPNGVAITKGRVENFAINEQTTSSSNLRGLVLKFGATADRGTIHVTKPNSQAVFTQDGDANLSHITASGPSNTGVIVSTTGSISIDHSSFGGFGHGIAMDAGALSVSDSLIDMGATSNGFGILMYNLNTSNQTLKANFSRISVVGKGSDQQAVFVGADDGMEAFTGSISDSLFYGSGAGFTPIKCVQAGGRPVALTIANTAFDPSKSVVTGSCAPAQTATVNLAAAPPAFVNAAAGDYRPAAGSSLIDAGSTGSGLAAGATDLAGSARLVNGKGACAARVDPGAFEFQPATAFNCEPVVQSPAKPTAKATAKVAAKAKKPFTRGGKGFVAPKSRKPYFSITYANAKTAKFKMQSIGKSKRLKSLKGSQTIKVVSGTTKYSFGGRWNKKSLKAGKYRVTITPISATGAAGKPVTVDIKLK